MTRFCGEHIGLAALHEGLYLRVGARPERATRLNLFLAFTLKQSICAVGALVFPRRTRRMFAGVTRLAEISGKGFDSQRAENFGRARGECRDPSRCSDEKVGRGCKDSARFRKSSRPEDIRDGTSICSLVTRRYWRTDAGTPSLRACSCRLSSFCLALSTAFCFSAIFCLYCASSLSHCAEFRRRSPASP